MKNNKLYFINERNRVNDEFFGANGFVDDNFYGNSYSANGFTDDSNFYGNSYSANGGDTGLVPTSVPYIFSIANSTASQVTNVVLLGANQNTTSSSTNFGNNVAITITQQNGAITYAQFLQSLKSFSFKIGEIQLQSSNTTQPFNTFTISQTQPNGATSSLPYYPTLNPFQNQNTVSVVKQIMPVNSWTQFTFTIEASATLTVRLYPAENLDISNAVIGRPASMGFRNPGIDTQPMTLQLPKGS